MTGGGGVMKRAPLCAFERALWWHQKTKHDLTHRDAMKEVEAERNALSVILNGSLVRIAPGVAVIVAVAAVNFNKRRGKIPTICRKRYTSGEGWRFR